MKNQRTGPNKRQGKNTNYSHSTSRPNQNVRDTSVEAYVDHVSSGKHETETQITYRALLGLKKANRKMLSKATGFEINKITEYVKQILLSGKAVELDAKEKCPYSNRRTHFLVLTTNDSSNKSESA